MIKNWKLVNVLSAVLLLPVIMLVPIIKIVSDKGTESYSLISFTGSRNFPGNSVVMLLVSTLLPALILLGMAVLFVFSEKNFGLGITNAAIAAASAMFMLIMLMTAFSGSITGENGVREVSLSAGLILPILFYVVCALSGIIIVTIAKSPPDNPIRNINLSYNTNGHTYDELYGLPAGGAQQFSQIQPSQQFSQIMPSQQFSQIQPSQQFSQIQPSQQFSQIQPSQQFSQIQPSQQFSQIQPSQQFSQSIPSQQIPSQQQFSQNMPSQQIPSQQQFSQNMPSQQIPSQQQFSQEQVSGALPENVEPAEPVDEGEPTVQCAAGDYDGASFVCEGVITIGSDPSECNIVISGDKVSAVHCTVRYDSEKRKYIVTDKSVKGVYSDPPECRLPANLAIELSRGTLLSIGDETNKFILN